MGIHFEILQNLLKNRQHKVIAEIGVFEGKCTKSLLDALPNIEKYYAIDLWEHYPEFDAGLDPNRRMLTINLDKVFNEFLKRIDEYKDKIEVMRMMSRDAADKIEDESLDLVFIDANHTYEFVKEDIILWLPKVKKGGIISGHDYGIEYRKPKYGVTKAVDELIPSAKIKSSVWYDIKG